MGEMDHLAQTGAHWLVTHCASVGKNDRALVLANLGTQKVAEFVLYELRALDVDAILMLLPDSGMHGGEPTTMVAEAMANATVIFCLTSMSLAHSKARFAATKMGARFLSLPDYTLEVIAAPSLLMDYSELLPEVDAIGRLLDGAGTIQIKSPLGTDAELCIDGRYANRASGLVRDPGTLGSPPDAEVNIAPLEDSCSGIVVIDGSIPCREVGLLSEPVTLQFEKGVVRDIASENASTAETVTQLFDRAGPNARVLGEFGIGLNPLAKLCGRMLEDEGCRGTIHFGIGSNATIGGLNNVPFHLDFVMRHPDVMVDRTHLIKSGEILPLISNQKGQP